MHTPRHHTKKSAKQGNKGERQFIIRLMLAFALIVLLFITLGVRFFYLQVVKYDDYSTRAQNNRISLIPTAPTRGLIVDRNGVVLARNYAAYSLELIPNQLPGKIDETIEALRPYVDITNADMKRFQKFRADSRSFDNIPLKLKLTQLEADRLAPHLYRFQGVEINARSFREYPYADLTAHVLGYIGRISQKDQDRLIEEDKLALYRGSTHIGKIGLEEYYEADLHGVPGFEEVEKDAFGQVVRVLRTTAPESGNMLQLSLDIKLQKKADDLLGDRRGAIVAIDPQTGGVLALVSKPSFDPNLFIDGIDTESWKGLNENPNKPMINRAIRGLYPPGSTFKPFFAMAALESGSVSQTEVRAAPGSYSLPGSTHQFRDSVRSGHGSANLSKAITVSSDTFFYKLGFEMGIDKIHPYLAEFGLGQYTGIDIHNESRGILPSKEWKEERFAKSKPSVRNWTSADTVNISIGQGYNAYTPLQMANATAILANGGKAFKPHLVQSILDSKTNQRTVIEATPSKILPYKQNNFEYVRNAMVNVMKAGTGRRIGAGLQYEMGGKTGTAQVVQIKQGARYNASALAEIHRDHSWFIAFAPANTPRIAIAVIVENGGFGARAAAPIVRALTDFYMLSSQYDAAPVPTPLMTSLAEDVPVGPTKSGQSVAQAFQALRGPSTPNTISPTPAGSTPANTSPTSTAAPKKETP